MKKLFLLFLLLFIHIAKTMDIPLPGKKLSVVYSPNYDITFLGIEKYLHYFDSTKYSKVAQYLEEKNIVTKENFIVPKHEITEEELKKVHGEQYLSDLQNYPAVMFTRIACVPLLAFMPNFIVRNVCLYPMRLATQGTLDATDAVLRKDNANNCAINLSGGYHHACANRGDGFCVYADIPLAVYKAITEYNIKKTLIVDLDAHQGDGHEEIFNTQETFKNKVHVFDIYNPGNFPQRSGLIHEKQWATSIHVSSGYSSSQYLKELEKLQDTIEQQKPEFIIYNAGTDIYENDPLGKMKVTQEDIIKRDHYVFQLALKNNIPLVMVLSGGYTQESAGIISQSIENLHNTFFKET